MGDKKRYLLHYLDKLTNIAVGNVDQFNVTRKSFPKVLSELEQGETMTNIELAWVYAKMIQQDLNAIKTRLKEAECLYKLKPKTNLKPKTK